MASDLEGAEASSSSKVPRQEPWSYDVFISFRGVDTRDCFIGHLYHALSDAGINVFKDDEKLREGEEISFGLVRAIRGSRDFVVVLSRNYANSRWCLDELEEIVKWRGAKTSVLCVFYGVDLNDMLTQIYNLRNSRSLVKHYEGFLSRKVNWWKDALVQVAAFNKGLTLVRKDEAMLIERIVAWAVRKKSGQYQREAEIFPANLEANLLDVDSLASNSEMSRPEASSPLPARGSSWSWKYDVFLSYRGVDTRGKFTSHLYHALTGAGINTLKDDESLHMGEEISLGLARAIRGSRVSVVVLSRNFASSTWCLEELVEIMKWRQTTGQLVLPIFYDVDPSDVRKQTGSFSEAFIRHEQVFLSENKRLARWRDALTEVGHLSGWVVGNSGSSKDEARTIREVVRRIAVVLNEKMHLEVASFPVGLDSYQADIDRFLSLGSSCVCFVGILGMGGIGKTTVAKAIYNRLINQFEGKSFLASVRTSSEHPNSIVRLQEQLLRDTLNFKQVELELSNTHQGMTIIKEKLRSKRVLIVLDDISDLDQVRALAGDREWFGSGSRIILTTRYQQVLDAVKADGVYKVKPLNDSESLQLFCSHAFGESYPREGFSGLSNQILGYSQGVPLVLEILGRYLQDKSKEDWNNTLEKLKIVPDSRIQAQLRISFDELGHDDKLKEIFLDIACFFVGSDKDYVTMILEACGLFAKKGMVDLIDRCLIEVDGKNQLQMHDLLRDMGREIVREESPNNPGKRSRLWLHKDILSTIRSELGTEEVEGIAWCLSELDKVSVSAEAFATMKKLRLLKLMNVHINGEYGLISKELRWLCWHNCSLQLIPKGFDMENLVALDMQYSNLRQVWKHGKLQGCLKVLNLSHSHFLTKTPDFSKLPNLEELILEDCIELAYVHPSVGYLERLVLMNFKDCRKLRNFPASVERLKSLRVFNISGCSKIDRLPEDFRILGSLVTLIADGTAITQLPSSIKYLENLTDLSLSGSVPKNSVLISSRLCSCITSRLVPNNNCPGISFFHIRSLKALKLRDCNLLDKHIAGITSLLSLEYLDLRKNNFRFLPNNFHRLIKLKNLLLDDCCTLQELPVMPPGLLYLSAVKCVSLGIVNMSKFGSEMQLILTDCHKLRMIAGLDWQKPEGSIHLERCNNLSAEFRDFLLKDWCGSGCSNVFLPGSDIPKWFDHQTAGSSLSFNVPALRGRELRSFTVCITYVSKTNSKNSQAFPSLYIEDLNISFSAVSYANIAVTHEDHMWVFYLPDSVLGDRLECLDEVKLTADFGVGWDVKRLGVHFRKDAIPLELDNFELDPRSYMPVHDMVFLP